MRRVWISRSATLSSAANCSPGPHDVEVLSDDRCDRSSGWQREPGQVWLAPEQEDGEETYKIDGCWRAQGTGFTSSLQRAGRLQHSRGLRGHRSISDHAAGSR